MSDNFHYAMRIRQEKINKETEKHIRHDDLMRESIRKSNPQNHSQIQNIMKSPLYKTAKKIDSRTKKRETAKRMLQDTLEIMSDEMLDDFIDSLNKVSS